MLCIKFLWLLVYYIYYVQASTHWMVTENGLIEPRSNSPFQMAHPHDLLGFLNQDTRWNDIVNLYHDLTDHQKIVNEKWKELEENTDIASIIESDENCSKSGELSTIEWYVSFIEDGKSKGIPDEQFYESPFPEGEEYLDVPDCKKISSLTFSMFAFEHLEGMIRRQNLSAERELSLPDTITEIFTTDQFGVWVAEALRLNTSSWLHYNLAALYWRVNGNAPKAMECCRRAAHYAPRRYKDIVFFNMGSIFHRSKMTEDAITVLNAAVDHDPTQPIYHFTLANAYAVSGDYNSSIRHYELCLKLDPRLAVAVRHRHGVLCHVALSNKVINIRKCMKELREELKEYSQKEAHWLKTQADFLKTMKHSDGIDQRKVDHNCALMTQITGLNIQELNRNGEKNALIQYFLEGPMYNDNDRWSGEKGVHSVDYVYSVQRLIRHIEGHASTLSHFVMPTPDAAEPDGLDVVKEQSRGQSADNAKRPRERKSQQPSDGAINNEMFEFEGGPVLFPPSMQVKRNLEDFDVEESWPSQRLCDEAGRTSSIEPEDFVYPVFMPFQNKGISIKYLLTDRIGVPRGAEHPLPWHPPLCPIDKHLSTYTGKKSVKQQTPVQIGKWEYLVDKLSEYVGDGRGDAARHLQHAEIGHRIYTAMQMELAPKWILYTLSSLYWRVRENNVNALNCLLGANRSVPQRYKDVVLASLASVLLEMGFFEDALAAAEEAYKLSLYEPSTNLVLSQLNMVKRHRSAQLLHLKQAVRVCRACLRALPRRLLVARACADRTHHHHAPPPSGFSASEVCAEVEPGVSLVCERDGDNCRVAKVHCYTDQVEETSTVVRMLMVKGEQIHASTPLSPLGEGEFQLQWEGLEGGLRDDHHHNNNHQRNYETMRAVISDAVATEPCHWGNCDYKRMLKMLKLRDEECTHQYLQLGYWVHSVTLQPLFSDALHKLPLEIVTLTPSSNKIPECALYSDFEDDFFNQKLSKLDLDGWEPQLSLMHSLSEAFNSHEFISLGPKIAKYVEIEGGGWRGAAAGAWWCGAGGYARCAARCVRAALANARAHPDRRQRLRDHHAVLRLTIALLHMQGKLQDAKEVAYLNFYLSPKSTTEAFLAAVSHTHLNEYGDAIWMYRYALNLDEDFLPAKACLHANMCLVMFAETRDRHGDN